MVEGAPLKVYVLCDDCDDHMGEIRGIFISKDGAIAEYAKIVEEHAIQDGQTEDRPDLAKSSQPYWGKFVKFGTDENDVRITLVETELQ
jgi:hypothetical protein